MVRCSHCGSASVKKSSAYYAQSTSFTRRRSSGVWLSGRGTGVWFGRSASRRRTLAAAQNAPLQVSAYVVALCGTVGMVVGIYLTLAIWPDDDFFDGLIHVWLLSMSLLVAGVILGWHWTKKWREEEEGFNDRRWYCSKCGSTFFVDLTKHSPEKLGVAASGSQIASLLSGSRRTDYVQRVQHPVQRARQLTSRDLDGLRNIAQRVRSDWRFEPGEPWPMDLGIVSRLASKGCISYDDTQDSFFITDEGRELLS